MYVGVQISEDEKTVRLGNANRMEIRPFGCRDYPAYARKLDALRAIGALLEMIPDSDDNSCRE